MSDRPTFAVVIPTYNRATRLVNTLETVFGQAGQATEIIVVDTCSTDETPEVMSSTPGGQCSIRTSLWQPAASTTF